MTPSEYSTRASVIMLTLACTFIIVITLIFRYFCWSFERSCKQGIRSFEMRLHQQCQLCQIRRQQPIHFHQPAFNVLPTIPTCPQIQQQIAVQQQPEVPISPNNPLNVL